MTAQVFFAKWGLKILGGVILLIIIVSLFFIWQSSRDKAKVTQAAGEQGVRTDVAASGISTDAGVAQNEGVRVDIAVTDSRQDYQRGYEDAKRNDPNVADWGDRPIPQRLRDLARERRESRERLGRPGSGRESTTDPEGSGGNDQAR